MEVVPLPGVRMGLLEREVISQGCRWGKSYAEIARRIGRPVSTVSREVIRNGGRQRYSAWVAQLRTQERMRRPKTPKLVAQPFLGKAVADLLERKWSPEQICARLRVEHPDEPAWWVSHETIYRSLYVQGRGGLRAELTKALRTGRARRRPRRTREPGRHFKDMVMISDRPAEVEDRAVPGHWEGDTILGTNKQSQVGTLVERTSRLVLLVHLPRSREATVTARAVAKKIKRLPDQLRLTLTWDQGSEMGAHRSFTVATGCQVYFCDPRSPWQRGTAENTNGLLRQYLPRSTDLSVWSEKQLDAIAAEMNDRPRKALGWKTPAERFSELVAMTQ